MSWLIHEWRLVQRSRFTIISLLLLLLLTTIAVIFGINEIAKQRQTITRLGIIQQQELIAQQSNPTHKGDVGTVAYYTFLETWNQPSDAAFLASGFRDATPYVLRIRALALQTQLHEGEIFNPELALIGRFDFAFILVYLVPLFLIALFYDIISNERQTGRLITLLALSKTINNLWIRRFCLRIALVFMCLFLPITVGSLITGLSTTISVVILIIIFAYLCFWAGLALIVSTRNTSSINNAITLIGLWIILTFVLPAIGNTIQTQLIPINQGVELMLAQRQVVHAAWDTPREDTMQKFFKTNPKWENTAPLPAGFHWKWYYAFQQLGDESVSTQVASYREKLFKRQYFSQYLGWFLPSVGVQTLLHRIAKTDLLAQLNYQDKIVVFHKQLRNYYYYYLFNEIEFKADDFAKIPRFQPLSTDNSLLNDLNTLKYLLLAMITTAGLTFFLGIRATYKINLS